MFVVYLLSLTSVFCLIFIKLRKYYFLCIAIEDRLSASQSYGLIVKAEQSHPKCIYVHKWCAHILILNIVAHSRIINRLHAVITYRG